MKTNFNLVNGNGNNVAKTTQQQVQRVGNKRALNAPSFNDDVVGLQAVGLAVIERSPLREIDGYLVTEKGNHYSPFGHGNGIKDVTRIATNAQIDRALCKGNDTTSNMVESYHSPSRVCNRFNEYDLEQRPELDNCLNDKFSTELKMNHLGFLAGKGNGKNTLQKRLFKVMPDATIEELNSMAMMIHQVAAPMVKKAERCYNGETGKNQHKFADYVDAGEYGVEHKSLSELR